MVKFFKKVFGGGDGKAANTAAARPSFDESVDMPTLMEIVRYFPMGEKVRYYPEFQKDAALDTLILGYGINDEFIFSPMNLKHEQEGDHVALHLVNNGEEHTVERVDNFALLIPYNREDDNKRDYQRRAELGPRGPFRRYNTISLQACSTGGILSTLDTVVRKVLPITEGIYAGHEMVLLHVVPKSLHLTDQRQHYRLKTRLPATLRLKDGGTHECTLLDFSEESLQLQFDKPQEEIQNLSEWRRLTLTFDVSASGQPKLFELDGTMYRKKDDRVVMKLQGIYKEGSVETLGLVDILDIKSSLLKHPVTQQILQNA
jgi:hypothetical protein